MIGRKPALSALNRTPSMATRAHRRRRIVAATLAAAALMAGAVIGAGLLRGASDDAETASRVETGDAADGTGEEASAGSDADLEQATDASGGQSDTAGDDASGPADVTTTQGTAGHGAPPPPVIEPERTGTVSPLEPALAPASAPSLAQTPTTDRSTATADEQTPPSGSAETSTAPSPLPSAAPATPGGLWRPKPGTSWQWQLTGTLDTSVDVDVYDVDLFDVSSSAIDRLHADGRVVICYFSAGAWEDWRPDANSLDSSLLGSSNGWPGEKWIDISRVSEVGPFIEARLDLAVSKGCDAVEPDNVDGYQNNPGVNLTASDQIVFNSFVAKEAHARGLSVGLKNAAELVGVLEPLFDWALVEECARFDECGSYSPFITAGKAVFHVEYQGNHDYCAHTSGLGFSSLEKDMDVGALHRPCS